VPLKHRRALRQNKRLHHSKYISPSVLEVLKQEETEPEPLPGSMAHPNSPDTSCCLQVRGPSRLQLSPCSSLFGQREIKKFGLGIRGATSPWRPATDK
jgi:hypothetical protein